MINLLPPEEKEIILSERRSKIIIIVLLLAFFFFLSFALVLFSLEFYIKGQVDYQKTILKNKEDMLNQFGINDFENKAAESNEIIRKLNDFYRNKFYFSEMFESFSDTIPYGIYLNNFSITDSVDSFKFTASGFSPTREALFEFKNNLEKANFQQVFFPQTNWVKAEDINFYISFELPKNK